MQTPDLFAQFFRNGWEVRCTVTRAGSNGTLVGRAAICRGDSVKFTLTDCGVHNTRLELLGALKANAFRWIAEEEPDLAA
jgi:hypothetical protein